MPLFLPLFSGGLRLKKIGLGPYTNFPSSKVDKIAAVLFPTASDTPCQDRRIAQNEYPFIGGRHLFIPHAQMRDEVADQWPSRIFEDICEVLFLLPPLLPLPSVPGSYCAMERDKFWIFSSFSYHAGSLPPLSFLFFDVEAFRKATAPLRSFLGPCRQHARLPFPFFLFRQGERHDFDVSGSSSPGHTNPVWVASLFPFPQSAEWAF